MQIFHVTLLLTLIHSKLIHPILVMISSHVIIPSMASSSLSSIPTSHKVTISTENKIKNIINRINQWKKIHLESDTSHHLPFVSVTYAQSIDGMIAIKSNYTLDEKDLINLTTTNQTKAVSSNLELSCKESFQLTHALRSIHDGILIGGNTLLHDNPRLNNRLWREYENDENEVMDKVEIIYKQPVPIILDTNLNYLLQMMKCNTAIRAMLNHDKIIICCCEDSYYRHYEEIKSRYECNTIHLLKCKCNKEERSSTGDRSSEHVRLSLNSVLENLRSKHDIKSVMVEGGSSILSCFMSQAEHIVNCICITIVPKMIGGHNGLLSMQSCNLVQQNGNQLRGFEFDSENSSWSTIGSDCIFLAPCRHDSNTNIEC